MNTLSGWENFYVIVGSSAGALIGLQFVVITLLADRPMGPGQEQAGAAFGTPTIVHFCAVLFLATIRNRSLGSALHPRLGLGTARSYGRCIRGHRRPPHASTNVIPS